MKTKNPLDGKNFIVKNWKNRSIDLFIIFIGIPGLLYLLFLLPADIKEMLILHRDYFNGLDIFANNFVHKDFNHLESNLIFYGCLIFILYILLFNNRRLFYTLLVINLFIVPLVISLIWIPVNRFVIKQISITYGFSGIVSSIAGMVIYGCILYLHKKINIDILNACYSLLTFAALLLTLNYSSLKENLLAIIFLFAIFLFELYQTMKSIDKKAKEKWVIELSKKAEAGLIKISKRLSIFLSFLRLIADFIGESSLFFVYLVATFIMAFLFPNTFSYGNTIVNFFIHYLGFAIGIAIFYLINH
jgi:hypothetical protein